MKILHTSDWHLGQNFMGKSRIEEHRRMVDWLARTVKEHGVDMVILAGDVFDTSTPPSYARELYHDCVVKLNQLGCRFVVVAGNHDSVSVLNESKSLLKHMHTYVVTQPSCDQPQDCLIPIQDGKGETQGVVCAIPFLRAQDMVKRELGQSSEQKHQQLSQSIVDYYQLIFDAAKQHYPEVPIIGTGHFTLIGGEKTDSVREIYVGTLEALSPSLLPAFDYLALGHIHKPMQVAGKETWRYSGSPMPMSFDEAKNSKSMVLYDTVADNVALLTIPQARTLITLKGNREELMAAVSSLDDSTDLAHWLEITVTEDTNLGNFQTQLRELIQDRNIDILRVQRQRNTYMPLAQQAETSTLDDVSPKDVFDQLLVERDIPDEQAAPLRQLFEQVLQECEVGPGEVP